MQLYKLNYLTAIFIVCLLLSCGPSAEEKASAEKELMDSVSAARAQMEAAKEAARQQAIDDSIRQADTTAIGQ